MTYIDCDGVILDTETGLFDMYEVLKRDNPSLRKTIYLQELDWDKWLQDAKILNDAINILKNYDPKNNIILTKVHSLKEGESKINYFRNLQIKNDVIIVPYTLMKSQIVNAKNNILIDDGIKNLDDWYNAGGIPIYYGDNISEYVSVSSLEDVLLGKVLKKSSEY